jgi:cobalt-zinc-cadmium efflux system protein
MPHNHSHNHQEGPCADENTHDQQHEHNHSHGHGHGHSHSHFGSAAGRNRKNLYIVLGLTGSFLLVEVIGGLLTGSLALLADAGHMMTDVFGLLMALIAIRLGERPANGKKTYGYYRTEILAALLNAALLLLVSGYILYEAIQRFSHPETVLGEGMLGVAVTGLLVNLASLVILSKGADESLNIRGAYLEVMSDMLGSVGVIVAGIIILMTNWYLADPIVGVGIGLFVVPRAFTLLGEALNILLEGVPKGVNMDEVRQAIQALPYVVEVHDLHLWTITSGMHAMSGHVRVCNLQNYCDILGQIQGLMHRRFDIEHCTIQLEIEEFAESMKIHP